MERKLGNCIFSSLPLRFFSRREVLEGFLAEKTIRNVVRLYSLLDRILMGIGIPSMEHATRILTARRI